MNSYGKVCSGWNFADSHCGWITSVSPEISSHLPLNMYNSGAFGFAVVSSTLLYRTTCLSVICRTILRVPAHTSTKGTQQHHGNRNSKVV
jgi:hypothetical protein